MIDFLSHLQYSRCNVCLIRFGLLLLARVIQVLPKLKRWCSFCLSVIATDQITFYLCHLAGSRITQDRECENRMWTAPVSSALVLESSPQLGGRANAKELPGVVIKNFVDAW